MTRVVAGGRIPDNAPTGTWALDVKLAENTESSGTPKTRSRHVQELDLIQPEGFARPLQRAWRYAVAMRPTFDPFRLLLISVAGWLGQPEIHAEGSVGRKSASRRRLRLAVERRPWRQICRGVDSVFVFGPYLDLMPPTRKGQLGPVPYGQSTVWPRWTAGEHPKSASGSSSRIPRSAKIPRIVAPISGFQRVATPRVHPPPEIPRPGPSFPGDLIACL
jgi:hypothetical protein